MEYREAASPGGDERASERRKRAGVTVTSTHGFCGTNPRFPQGFHERTENGRNAWVGG